MELILKGILIGLSISVPLGPIGMLCIQRTLNRGQKHGLITGLGATTSDILYAIITMFFLNYVIGTVEQHKLIIQLAGSIIIIIFGLWIYNSNPMAQPRVDTKDKSESSLLSDYFTSFALTLSNPLILFVLIALFAQFDFIAMTGGVPATIVVGLLSIIAGATSWWLFLTSFASRFRAKFNLRGLKLINRVIGVIIIFLGLLGTLFSLT